MKISELIEKLTGFQVKNGDLRVVPSINIHEKGIGLELVVFGAEVWWDSMQEYRRGGLKPVSAKDLPEGVCLIKFG